jgi:hypothetical protein
MTGIAKKFVEPCDGKRDHGRSVLKESHALASLLDFVSPRIHSVWCARIVEGYEITDIQQDHIFPFVVEKCIKYEYEVSPWFAAMPGEMFTALEKTLGWHMLITTHLS